MNGDAFFPSLFEEDAGLAVDAAEVDQIGVGGQNRRQDAVEVRLLFGAFEAQHLQAVLLGSLAQEFGDALPVGSFVVHDVDALGAKLLAGELLRHDALHVIAPDDAVDFRVAAVGDDRVGGRRRNH